MVISKDKVVSFHYTLKDDEGQLLDSSEGKDPLSYVHGSSAIILGLEQELEGKKAGDSLHVDVAPDQGYGQFSEELIMDVSKDSFDNNDNVAVGMQFQAQTDKGMQVFTVKEVKEHEVTMDGNHPLAGMNLHFDVSVVDVRDATAEELDHGHVH